MDFLAHFHLLVDGKHHRLIDGTTSLHTNGTRGPDNPNSTAAIGPAGDRYDELLRQCPSLLRQNVLNTKVKEHHIEHHIQTKGPPVHCRPRRLPADKLKAAKREFEYMMQQGLCRPSKSNWASPLHLTLKKSGDWRPCGNYRRLNSVTTPDRYSIPFLTDCLHTLRGAKIFSNIDLIRAYQQIPVHEADIAKTAISTPTRRGTTNTSSKSETKNGEDNSTELRRTDIL